MRFFLWLLFGGWLCFSAYNQAVRHGLIEDPVAYVFDLFDERPVFRILMIGNSRTYYNHMPFMVRKIADSAGAPYKVQITMHALPSRSLEQHWNNSRVHELIEAGWDRIVLQEKSGGHWYQQNRQNFSRYGRKLVDKAKSFAPQVSLLVGWPYSLAFFEGNEKHLKTHFDEMQKGHQVLSRETGAALINVGAAWVRQLDRNPQLRLESDGNHPNVYGSFLAALAIYASLPDPRLSSVTYSPFGVAKPEAVELNASVERSLHFQGLR